MSEFTVENSKEVFEIRIKGSKQKFTLPAWDRLPARVAFQAAKAQRKGEDAETLENRISEIVRNATTLR